MKTFLRPLLAALALGLAFATAATDHAASMSAERRVARLDELVKLSRDQKAQAMEIFREETTTLDMFTVGEERATKGEAARVASRAQIRAILTPEQRKKYDISPQTLGGGSMVNTEMLLQRLNQVIPLSEEQKAKAVQIIWNEYIDQVAAIPADQPTKGFSWSQAVRDHLRAILTPQQQAIFDVTPPYRSSGPGRAKTGG